jgi:hypothetical protein
MRGRFGGDARAQLGAVDDADHQSPGVMHKIDRGADRAQVMRRGGFRDHRKRRQFNAAIDGLSVGL